MEDKKFIYQETVRLMLGQALCISAMFGIFALLGCWDTKVLLGGIVGGIVTVANFFAMAIVASLAADKAQAQNVAGGQALIRGSYLGRLLVMFVIFFAFAKSGLCNVIAMVLPLAFVKPILMIGEFFRKKGDVKP